MAYLSETFSSLQRNGSNFIDIDPNHTTEEKGANDLRRTAKLRLKVLLNPSNLLKSSVQTTPSVKHTKAFNCIVPRLSTRAWLCGVKPSCALQRCDASVCVTLWWKRARRAFSQLYPPSQAKVPARVCVCSTSYDKELPERFLSSTLSKRLKLAQPGCCGIAVCKAVSSRLFQVCRRLSVHF